MGPPCTNFSSAGAILRTRYIALASIISVMLGVATMIVVNAVMEGFSHEMQDRIHGILSDIVFESQSLDGFPDADRRMEEIRKVAAQYIEGMSPTVARSGHAELPVSAVRMSPARSADWRRRKDVRHGERLRPVPAASEESQEAGLRLEAKVATTRVDHQATDPQQSAAGGTTCRSPAGNIASAKHKCFDRTWSVPEDALDCEPLRQESRCSRSAPNSASTADQRSAEGTARFDPGKEQHTGAVLGIGSVQLSQHDGSRRLSGAAGRRCRNQLPHRRQPPKSLSDKFTGRRFLRKQNERIRFELRLRADSQAARAARHDRSATGIAQLQRDSDPAQERRRSGHGARHARGSFPPQCLTISTWRDKQGAAARGGANGNGVLNVLLFLIIAVAGFGILAIFFMIVVEKTRDIGILKSLGAPAGGFMGIFLRTAFAWALSARVWAWSSACCSCTTSTRLPTSWGGLPGRRSSTQRSTTSKRFRRLSIRAYRDVGS